MSNNIIFYRLVSPYQEDTTKNCGLTSAQIDGNNLSLKEYDVKSIYVTGSTIQLKRVDGTLENATITNQNIVTNLNADLLDGHHASYFVTSSTLTGYVTTGTTINGYTLNNNVVITAHDTGAYTSGETNSLINILNGNIVTGQTYLYGLITGETANRITGDTNLQNIKVDKTQTINGYQLTGNTTISAHDVGAYTTGETDSIVTLLNNNITTGQTYLYGLITGETANRITGDTNLQNIKVDKTQTINGYELTGNTTISAHDVGAYTSGETNALITQTPGTSTGLTISQNGFTVYRNMISTGTTVTTVTGATITPDFTDDIYKTQSNYTSGNTVLVSGYTSMPVFDTCKCVTIKNTKNADVTIALQSSTLTQGSVTYTFEFMGDNSVLVPTTKTIEVSYLFKFNSLTTCDVSIIYIIQA
jgi:hypothetical protein